MHAQSPPPSDDTEKEFVRRLLAEHERAAHASALNAAELVAVRELLESDRRWKWMVNGLKTWALWLTAVAAASTVGMEALKGAVKALGR